MFMQKNNEDILLLNVYPSFTIESMLILCRRKGNKSELDFIVICKKNVSKKRVCNKENK